ncbi:DUF563 domain-containing protein [Chitinophaga sp. HK235]|uniref:glycosyltransferase family 61 protein n=1 Tax=Chitinophaga sp. HK235 TaxID=2952571 RepID=UPI001BA5F9EF|nr:glycosyltransferase family 61 protein [Chitinophaga sp. HK235]
MKLFIKPFRKIEKGLWIINEWSFEYFHWLADALPRLLAAGDYQQYGPVLLPEYYATRPYVVESLQRLNVPVLFFNPRKRLLVKELTVVSPTASTGNFNEPAILPVRERLMVHGKQAVRKIYISRQKAAKRRITNEEEVIAIFREAGFEIHYFEDYPFTRQLEIMGETRVLAGLHGAGLTNMLFMPPGGSILELRNVGDTHSNSFYSQAAAMRHSYYYLLCQGSSADTHNTDFLVDTAQLKAALADMNNAEIKSL